MCIFNPAEPHVQCVWEVPEVVIGTIKGRTRSSQMGRLVIVDSAGICRSFEGYLVPDSPYSLWPVQHTVRGGGVYTENESSARVEYPDGSVLELRRQQGMWVVDIDAESGEIACAASVAAFRATLMILIVSIVSEVE